MVARAACSSNWHAKKALLFFWRGINYNTKQNYYCKVGWNGTWDVAPAENERGQRPEREGKLSNPRSRAARAPCMEKIYENPRSRATRTLCSGYLLIKSTVHLYGCTMTCTPDILQLKFCSWNFVSWNFAEVLRCTLQYCSTCTTSIIIIM
jgi:hypothetical protein